MSATPVRMLAPRLLSSVWWLTATASAVAAPVLLATQPYWHVVRVQLAQLGLWQCWVSVLACVALLLLSRRRHAEQEEPWAQGPLLIGVLGGLLSAIVLQYGVLPQWLVDAASLRLSSMVVGLLLLHWLCASWVCWRLWRWRAAPAQDGSTTATH